MQEVYIAIIPQSTFPNSKLAYHGFMHTLSEILDIAVVQARHRDTSISRHIDMRFLCESLRLGRSKAGEAMANVSLSAKNI